MAVVADIHLIGTAAARPAAASSNNGYLYCATDTNGGTLYRSNASSWVQIAAGVTGALSNVLTTTGDIIYSSSGTTAARLAIGATAGNVLKVAGGLPSWGFPTFFGCRVYNNANISITGGVNTIATFNTENYDQGGYHDTGSNTGRLTVPAGMGGYYNIVAALYWATSGTAYIRKNGDDNLQIGQVAPAAQLYTLSGQYQLSAGDYVELIVACGSTQNLLNFNAAYPSFGMAFMGA